MEGKMRADFLDRRTGFSGFTGTGLKAFGLNSSLPWDERLNSILLILSKNPFEMGHARRFFFLQR
jgi:hypothetical protein